MFRLQCHNDSVYELNPNILTETICDKMIDCGTSVGGKQLSENELFNKPILEDRLNEAQKSHISNICEKIIPTKKDLIIIWQMCTLKRALVGEL